MRITTDHDAIRAALGHELSADPVRATLLGTIAASLEDSAWCAQWDGGLVVRSSAGFPVALAGDPGADQARLAAALDVLPGLRGLGGEVTAVRALVAAMAPRPVRHERAERLLRLDDLMPPSVAGTSAIAGAEHRDTIIEWYAAFVAEADTVLAGDIAPMADRLILDGGCHLWLDPDGSAVSMAARRRVVAGSARIGPVYTPPEQRGHGYASGATAAATRSILAEGAIPVLFTDLANPTSNKIYRALGYQPVHDRVITIFA